MHQNRAFGTGTSGLSSESRASPSSAEQPESASKNTGTAYPIEVTVTYLLIVRDVERSRQFYDKIFGTETLRAAPFALLRLGNGILVLSSEGGPTPDKPDILAQAPRDLEVLSSALNLRVKDIHAAYERWSSAGATFLTPPREEGGEIRCYLRDPDGHLIEVGQTTGPDPLCGG